MRINILIDPSAYSYQNIGDTAMLEAGVTRLRGFWPDAIINILSADPDAPLLSSWGVQPLGALGSLAWSIDGVFVRSDQAISGAAACAMRLCRALRRRHGWLMQGVGSAALLWKRRHPRRLTEYLQGVKQADLVLLTGAGALNDSFKQLAFSKLETLELARQAGAITALVGQGIGPMADSALQKRAAQVLPHVDFIALRDGVGSLALLQSMGVSESRLTVTGDDAVGLAYDARRAELGTRIGMNLRVADYAAISPHLVSCVGAVVREAAALHGAPLLPLPISRYAGEDDWVTARLMLGDVSAPQGADSVPCTPAELLRLLPECRIVVAGSYHAAVLALSMGIPAVAIASSDYYVHKFQGLADQFGPACRVEMTFRPGFQERLLEAIAAAWRSAPAARGPLLTAAMRQIAAGEAAYQRVRSLVETRLRSGESETASKT